MSGSCTDERAAARCSRRIRSTVKWYSGSVSTEAGTLSGVKPDKRVGDGGRVRTCSGLFDGDCEWSLAHELCPLIPNKALETGVTEPEDPTGFFRGFNASDAARSSRFVVPSAFVDPERAEHTMATL